MNVSEAEQRVVALENTLYRLSAERDIKDILNRYARAADRCDVDLMKACYHPDAIDDHGFFSGNAWDFCDFVVRELRELELSVHSLSNSIIEFDGDRAFVETHYAVIHRIKSFLGFTDFYHHGRYLDVFEIRAGNWKIARRLICQDGERWLQTANFTGLLKGNRNLPLQGCKDDRDPVYQGFNVGTLIESRPTIVDLWGKFRRLAITPLFLVRILTILLRPFYRNRKCA